MVRKERSDGIAYAAQARLRKAERQHRKVIRRTAHLPRARNPPFYKQKKQAFACFFWWEEVVCKERSDRIAYAVQARLRKAERLQNNDRFVPKPLRFKCSRILSLFCVICARLLKGRWLFVGFACCHGVSPISVPLIASQQGIHGKSKGGDTLGLAVGSFSNCVTRFRDGALRHAKFPKTSYCLQLLDTLLHAACVSLNHKRRRGLISRSRKVLAQCCKT